MKTFTVEDMLRCISNTKPHVPIILNIQGKSKYPWAHIRFLSIDDNGPNAGKIIIHGKFGKAGG